MESYILKSTGDDRDRSKEIQQMLARYQVCILGSGVFYVSSVKMPDGTSLMGMGECSQLILKEEVQSGYAVLLGSRCAVKNLAILGAAQDLPRPAEMGDRHGIGFVGTATVENRTGQPVDCIIDGCQIRSFSGGGITCKDTGYNMDSSLCVSNCRIHFCGAGINISHFSEYHKFCNVVSTRNLYGCINNGGNNVFTGCAFDGNTVGFLIDNSRGQSLNNAHGTCTACTFNHTDFNKGVGIRILGSKLGYVFSGCQIFFSGIEVEASAGIQFDHCNIGKDQKIRIQGGGAVLFSGCVFSQQPAFRVEDNPSVKVYQCCTKSGETVEYT